MVSQMIRHADGVALRGDEARSLKSPKSCSYRPRRDAEPIGEFSLT